MCPPKKLCLNQPCPTCMNLQKIIIQIISTQFDIVHVQTRMCMYSIHGQHTESRFQVLHIRDKQYRKQLYSSLDLETFTYISYWYFLLQKWVWNYHKACRKTKWSCIPTALEPIFDSLVSSSGQGLWLGFSFFYQGRSSFHFRWRLSNSPHHGCCHLLHHLLSLILCIRLPWYRVGPDPLD